MRIAVFSDVHGNLPALEAVIGDAGEVDGYVCLGDVVNYGPWSDECVDVVAALKNSVYLAGNHEVAFSTGAYPGTNPIARAFFDHCYPAFTRQDIIRDLPTTAELYGFEFRHTIDDRYVYPDSVLTLTADSVIGHSHHQFVVEDSGFRLVNPGSVGQNRRYINIANYLLLETDTMTFEPRALRHDIDLVIAEMRRRDYPEECLAYYESKERWITSDPLPGFRPFSAN
ncbi:MAG: metallophosphoesterase family protein [Pseudolysinimonas sp.]|uniref:metallophosphoesterase family protein n=1 Tax=Pseudolysinimonas sp. TaxID=2680009 RepID=UPI003264B457